MTKSCGCLKQEALKAGRALRPASPHRSHGMSKTPEHRTWCNMWDRCTNKRNTRFKYYGKRGIAVCARWRAFENFYADMGARPPGMTLERKDNDKGYTPSNCRWATRAEQARNKQCTRRLTVDGVTRTLCEWAAVTGMPYRKLYKRSVRLGWPDKQVVC
jgi:hypothetical protein